MTPQGGTSKPTEDGSPTARSTWLALTLIVVTLVAVLVLLSTATSFRADQTTSTVVEAPADE